MSLFAQRSKLKHACYVISGERGYKIDKCPVWSKNVVLLITRRSPANPISLAQVPASIFFTRQPSLSILRNSVSISSSSSSFIILSYILSLSIHHLSPPQRSSLSLSCAFSVSALLSRPTSLPSQPHPPLLMVLLSLSSMMEMRQFHAQVDSPFPKVVWSYD